MHPDVPGDESEQPAIRVAVIAEMMGGDDSMVPMVLEDYRASAVETAEALIAAHAANQPAEVGSLAHKLKSSSKMVGADTVAALCLQLETAGKAGDATAVADLVPKFQKAFAAARAFIDDHLA